MSLDIFRHPTVERLMDGGKVTIQDLREALVDFWKENRGYELCANCPLDLYDSATGCCGKCKYHDLERGCIKRNIACQVWSCTELRNHLARLGVENSFSKFRGMVAHELTPVDQIYNKKRLPDDAPIFLEKSCKNPEGEGPPHRTGEVERVWLMTPALPVIAREEPFLSEEEYRRKLAETDCEVRATLWTEIVAEYPETKIKKRELNNLS